MTHSRLIQLGRFRLILLGRDLLKSLMPLHHLETVKQRLGNYIQPLQP
ncbi:MAG: hypothetical protein RLZ92_484 [Pseudomonadota bacterium]|jgi:hypothetical protein